MIIRERTENDIPGACETLVAVHEADAYPVEGVDDARGFLSGPDVLYAWVAEEHDSIVGHVAITRFEKSDPALLGALSSVKSRGETRTICSLGRLFVHPRARSKGVGRKLVETVQAYGKPNDIRLVLLVLDKDGAAIQMYQRSGWVKLMTVQHDNGKGERFPASYYASPEAHQ